MQKHNEVAKQASRIECYQHCYEIADSYKQKRVSVVSTSNDTQNGLCAKVPAKRTMVWLSSVWSVRIQHNVDCAVQCEHR